MKFHELVTAVMEPSSIQTYYATLLLKTLCNTRGDINCVYVKEGVHNK